ncbi:zinc-binding dehydrogenase [Nakamurella sp. YIM 132087]|uniref:Zinc-binding dehydrogenase n=1 Tax=Nakamurella alba TaxID=2665158 RepID=A0A7K1FEM8_9ACTN|nr:zinc-binding dehydrogenase [Nakamurella alba]MTD12565.1 zinc-binding dehydrogenase [Nakamurella alba]
MYAAIINGPGQIEYAEVPDPRLSTGGDAIVRVVASCVCGSDLWRYRGVLATAPGDRIGHEFIGVVEEIGPSVTDVRVGDFVVAPFYDCDMTCPNCLTGMSVACLTRSLWASNDSIGGFADGAQGELVRVPRADSTLLVLPEAPDEALVPHVLALCDVFTTGYHAARSAQVAAGDNVVVIGDGAVGLCAVLAASRSGAERIVVMSRHPDRQQIARTFGATDVLTARGAEAVTEVRDMFEGIGPDRVLECVGTNDAWDQAIRSVRPGGAVAVVGVPHGGPELPARYMFSNNIRLSGGSTPVRDYLPELLGEVIEGNLRPGVVFDAQMPLSQVGEAYRAMDERRSIKVMLRPGAQPGAVNP